MRIGNVVGAGLLLIACAEPSRPAESTRHVGPVAAQMFADRAADWRTVEVPGARIHVRRGNAADNDARAIGEAVAMVRQELLALLGGSQASATAPTAELFFVNSRDDTRKLTGQPLAGFVNPHEPTGVFVYDPGYRNATLIRHELTHLYTFQLWGAPGPGPLLVEGLAVWTAGTCQGHSADELTAGVVARGAFVPLKRLATAFREIREDVAMPEAGSIVGFLVRQRGLADIRERWTRHTPSEAHPLGPDGEKIERAWLEDIARARPATLDIPRVIREGC